MKPLAFLLLFAAATPAAAQITIVDNPYAPWNLPGNWCLWIALGGYVFAAGLLVYLWKTW